MGFFTPEQRFVSKYQREDGIEKQKGRESEGNEMDKAQSALRYVRVYKDTGMVAKECI